MMLVAVVLTFIAITSNSKLLERLNRKQNVGASCATADPTSIEFTSQNHQLKINGDRLYLQGASWFGFETQNYVVHGLWAQPWESLLDFYVTYGLNAIRLPFSVELVQTQPDPQSIDYNSNPDLEGLDSFGVMDVLIQGAADRGLLVMLDMHSLEAGGYMQDGLWYDDKYSEQDNMDAWKYMVDRYGGFWNIIGLDVFNEPFDATWGDGDSTTDFQMWSGKLGNYVHSLGVKWLINVEGVGNVNGACTPDVCFWGENLVNAGQYPVQLDLKYKLVYSPHVYGPSVAYQDYFNTPDFPNNMPAIWYQHWAYLVNVTDGASSDAAIVTGEWGGQMDNSTDQVWMEAFANYLDEIDQMCTYFWCLNPDSGDTGGLLEYDWITPVMSKINLLQQLNPMATQLTYNNQTNQVCW